MNSEEITQYITDLLTSDKKYVVTTYMTGRQPIEIKHRGQKMTVLGCTTVYTINANPVVKYVYQQYGPIGSLIPQRQGKHTLTIGNQVFEYVHVPAHIRRALAAAVALDQYEPRYLQKLAKVLNQR